MFIRRYDNKNRIISYLVEGKPFAHRFSTLMNSIRTHVEKYSYTQNPVYLTVYLEMNSSTIEKILENLTNAKITSETGKVFMII